MPKRPEPQKHDDGFTATRLPSPLIALLDQYVAENNEGYTTRSGAIAGAIREFLDRRNRLF